MLALHWHGIDVPNAMDGVAGVTQDSVPAGGEFTYRFVAEQRGTYWYHSHQVSNEQVIGGPSARWSLNRNKAEASDVDVLAVAHLYGGIKTINGLARGLPSSGAARQFRARPSDQHRQGSDRGLGRRSVSGAGGRRLRGQLPDPGVG